MTFSILARDSESGDLGGAVATGMLAVGSRVLNAQAGVGIVATQGYSGSTLLAEAALARLASNEAPEPALAALISADRGRDFRQLTILDGNGASAGWTGATNQPAKAVRLGKNLAIAGNWLTGTHVLASLEQAFLQAQGPLPERLLHALAAAFHAGGDSRGVISAALKVVSIRRPATDLRIDYSATPIDDLQALYQRTLGAQYQQYLARLPTRENPHRG